MINGELIGAKTLQNSKLKTYFGTISVFYRTEGVMVTVRRDRIDVVEGKNNHSFSWSGTAHINTNGYVYVYVCARYCFFIFILVTCNSIFCPHLSITLLLLLGLNFHI